MSLLDTTNENDTHGKVMESDLDKQLESDYGLKNSNASEYSSLKYVLISDECVKDLYRYLTFDGRSTLEWNNTVRFSSTKAILSNRTDT